MKEYKILCFLVANRNRVLTYEQIYQRVWGEDAIGNESNAVGCHVRNLRKKTATGGLIFRPLFLCVPIICAFFLYS